MDDLNALKQRIALATQKDVVHGMFIEHSLILLAKLKGQAEADKVRDELLGDKKLVSFFRYPVSDLLKVIERAVSNGEDCSETLANFGSNAVGIFFDSPVGKTMVMLASSNPQSLLFSAPAGFKATTSFGERSYKKTGERSGVMESHGELLGPSWQLGVFKTALKTACNVDVQMKVTKEDALSMNFETHVSW